MAASLHRARADSPSFPSNLPACQTCRASRDFSNFHRASQRDLPPLPLPLPPPPSASGMHNMRDKNDVRINIDGRMDARVEWSSNLSLPLLVFPFPLERDGVKLCLEFLQVTTRQPLSSSFAGKIEILAGIIDVLRVGGNNMQREKRGGEALRSGERVSGTGDPAGVSRIRMKIRNASTLPSLFGRIFDLRRGGISWNPRHAISLPRIFLRIPGIPGRLFQQRQVAS